VGNFKPEPMPCSSYNSYYISYISGQIHLTFQGAKVQFVSTGCSGLSLPAAVRIKSMGNKTVVSIPDMV